MAVREEQFKFLGPANGCDQYECTKCGYVYYLYANKQLDTLYRFGCRKCKRN